MGHDQPSQKGEQPAEPVASFHTLGAVFVLWAVGFTAAFLALLLAAIVIAELLE